MIHKVHSTEVAEINRILELIQKESSKTVAAPVAKPVNTVGAFVSQGTSSSSAPVVPPVVPPSSVVFGTTPPLMDGVASVGISPNATRSDHAHPSDTTKADLTGATFTGDVSVPNLLYQTTGVTPSTTIGATYWDAAANTLATKLDASVTLQHGQEMHIRCVNKSGADIADGSVVYIDTAQGNRPTIKLAKADALATCMVIGVATEVITNNQEGYVTSFGIVNGLDTRAYAAGDELHLSGTIAGALQASVPAAPYYHVMVATAMNSTVNGSIFVHPDSPLAQDTAFTANSNMVGVTQQSVKAYADTKLSPSLTSSYIFVGNASNVATGVAVTGDASMSNAGVLGVNKTRLNVRNETGVPIASTKAVYITGFNNYPLISLASNTDEAKHNVIGLTIAPIAHQANGFIATSGQCDAETNAWPVGTELYISTGGGLSSTEPTSGEVKHIGIVTVQSNYPAGKVLIYGQFEGAIRGVGASSGIVDRLGDDVGATAWSLHNYSNTEVGKITSLGAMTINGRVTELGNSTTAVASATLTAGQWVNFHNVAGVKNCRPADMTDATKPAQGFVVAGFATSGTATVYLNGANTVIPIGSYVAADVGKPVFLSTAGGTTLTPPTTTGNLLQQVGYVDAVGTVVTVNFINSPGIVRA